MHSLLMVSNLLAKSLLQKGSISSHFSYSSVKNISTPAPRTSLSNTVSFLEKESQPRASLVSLESVRFIFSCSQQLAPTRPLAMGCPHQSPLRKARPNRATWTQSVPMGHGPDPIWNTQPLPGAVPHASLPVFCSSQPLGFIAVPIFPLPTTCTLGIMPHSHLSLSRHAA